MSPSRILVVDDNPAMLYSTRRMLEAADFIVETAETGMQALTKLGGRMDLIVLDVNLPDVDGLEICRRVRANPETARIPVLHLSATFTKETHEAEGLAAGADGYLTHPVEPLVLLATIRSLLRARSAEEAMRRSEAKFRAIFNTAPTGISLLTESFEYVEVNPAMCELLGMESDEIVGKPLLGFVPRDRRDDAAALLRPGELALPWRGSFPLQRRGRETVEVEWNIATYPSSNYLLAIATDFTVRARLAAERERLLESERSARSEAERANRVKDDFLATLSHELRSPLHAIVGWAAVLRSRQQGDEVMRGLEAIERNALVQTQLIADLVDVSRISSGKLELSLEQMDLRALVESAIGTLKPTAEAKHTELTAPASPDPLWIRADPSRLQQVVSNLLSNALKFTPPGGHVEVRLVRTAGGTVELSVRDDGQGISPEFLPHLFERFRQADSSKTRTYSGLGLGLSIVRQLVELHGGSVWASSEGKGLGSTFTVSLPLAEEHDPLESTGSLGCAGATAPSRPRRLEGHRLLIVEDDPDTRLLMMRVLSDAGARVSSAEAMGSALRELEVELPDVLLSDIGMANQDGYELIRRVRARGISPQRLPAIAVTAFARPEDRQEALLAGYQEHVTKPVDPLRLVEIIRRLLD